MNNVIQFYVSIHFFSVVGTYPGTFANYLAKLNLKFSRYIEETTRLFTEISGVF